MIHYWWAVVIGCAMGYLIRWIQDSWDELSMNLDSRRQNRDREEVTRILNGLHVIDEVPPPMPVPMSPPPTITRSPMVSTWDNVNIPATGWDRALIPVAPVDADWPNEPSARRSLRQWWADMVEETKPRSPEQVALQVYEDAVLADGELYAGQHRVDGYNGYQVAALNTATAEYPSLCHLRTDWRDVPLPVPAEVIT
jgi:hypothetical protein